MVTSRFESSTDAHQNTTYTVDICQPLKKSGKANTKEECPNGTRGRNLFSSVLVFGNNAANANSHSTIVCAITRFLKGDQDSITKVIAIAGALENAGGAQFEHELTRLKSSDSNSDSQKEGLRLVLKGGKHPLTGPVKERKEQKAVIEFLCDQNRKGTEGEWDSEDKYEKASENRRRAEDDKKGKDEKDDGKKDDGKKDGDGQDSSIEHQLKTANASLIWEGYSKEKDVDVLRLTWHTKYACEKRDGNDDKDKDGGDDVSSHWGFFTWFVIM